MKRDAVVLFKLYHLAHKCIIILAGIFGLGRHHADLNLIAEVNALASVSNISSITFQLSQPPFSLADLGHIK